MLHLDARMHCIVVPYVCMRCRMRSRSHLGIELLGGDREPRMDQPKPLVPHAHLGSAGRDLALQQAKARLSPLAASTPSPSPAHLSHQAQLDRVTKLQEVARAEKEKRKTQALGPGMESLSPAPGPAVGPSACPRGRPPQSACKATYDAAHAALPRARVLVLDTETSGLAGCVLDLGWVLADSDGKELAAYSKLWLLPPGERIHSRAFQAHGIPGAEVQRDGVAPTPELQT